MDEPGFVDELFEVLEAEDNTDEVVADTEAGDQITPTSEDVAWWAEHGPGPDDGWTDADETYEERLRDALSRSALDRFLDEIPPEEWERQRHDHFDGLGDPLW
jgi:hypothetical protein